MDGYHERRWTWSTSSGYMCSLQCITGVVEELSKHSKGGHFVGSQEDCTSVVQSEKLHTCSGLQGYIYGVVKLVGAVFFCLIIYFSW